MPIPDGPIQGDEPDPPERISLPGGLPRLAAPSPPAAYVPLSYVDNPVDPFPTGVRLRQMALELAVQSHGPARGGEHDACFTARAAHFAAYLAGEDIP